MTAKPADANRVLQKLLNQKGIPKKLSYNDLKSEFNIDDVVAIFNYIKERCSEIIQVPSSSPALCLYNGNYRKRK